MSRFTDKYNREDFLFEGTVSKKMSKILVAPTLYEWFTSDYINIYDGPVYETFTCGFIIMDFLEETLNRYLLSERNTINPGAIRFTLLALIRGVTEQNIFHTIGISNVMFGRKDDVSTMKLIDWRPSKQELELNK